MSELTHLLGVVKLHVHRSEANKSQSTWYLQSPDITWEIKREASIDWCFSWMQALGQGLCMSRVDLIFVRKLQLQTSIMDQKAASQESFAMNACNTFDLLGKSCLWRGKTIHWANLPPLALAEREVALRHAVWAAQWFSQNDFEGQSRGDPTPKLMCRNGTSANPHSGGCKSGKNAYPKDWNQSALEEWKPSVASAVRVRC